VFTARYVLHSTFCPHSVFMCFVWIWEQTAIISLYSIDCLVFITETNCLLTTTEISHQVNVDTYFYVIYCTIFFDSNITIFIEVTITIAVKHTTLCLHIYINPLNAELNPICHLMALLGAHLIFHVSRIRVRRCVHHVSCPYGMQYQQANFRISQFKIFRSRSVIKEKEMVFGFRKTAVTRPER
jgi:hypothetical protein